MGVEGRARNGRPATIKEVAERAGVSIASVSRVVNRLDNVTPLTRDAVLKAIQSLNYVPNGAGRALATNRTNLIGVVLPDIYGEYFSELVRGVDLAARKKGLHLLVASSHGHADEANELVRQMHGRVDGLILMSPFLSAEELAALSTRDTPTVVLNSAPGAGLDSIRIDNFAGAKAATAHLIALGRRRIAHISGPTGNIEAEQRRAGFVAAVAEAGRGVHSTIFDGDFTDEAGDAVGRAIARSPKEVDGVFCANDMMALGFLAALNACGVRAPRDISVVGFDDIPLARFAHPALSTVSADIAEFGRVALARIVARIEDASDEVTDHTITPRLVVRKSCGAQGAPDEGHNGVRENQQK